MLGTTDFTVSHVMAIMYPTLSLLWGYLWLRVGAHYGAAAYLNWRNEGGQWRSITSSLLGPFTWAWRRETRADSTVPIVYSTGVILQFSIFLGTLTPGVFGILFAFLDRSVYSQARNALVLVFIFSSILAAGGHLFLALRNSPSKWRRLCLLSSLWLVAFPVVLIVYHHVL